MKIKNSSVYVPADKEIRIGNARLYQQNGSFIFHELNVDILNVDTINLSGVGIPSYIENTGTFFSGPLSGGTYPSLPNHLATVEYVDDAISGTTSVTLDNKTLNNPTLIGNATYHGDEIATITDTPTDFGVAYWDDTNEYFDTTSAGISGDVLISSGNSAPYWDRQKGDNVTFDNTGTTLSATNIQSAIEELELYRKKMALWL